MRLNPPGNSYGEAYETTLEEIEKAGGIHPDSILWASETLYLSRDKKLDSVGLMELGTAEAILRKVRDASQCNS